MNSWLMFGAALSFGAAHVAVFGDDSLSFSCVAS